MKKQLANLFNLFIKYKMFILKYIIVLPLQFGFFCTTTEFGAFFLYLLAFGIFFLPYPISMICITILGYVFIVAEICTILTQFEQASKMLIGIIGQDNFSKYVGDNPENRSTKFLLNVIVALVILVFIKISACAAQDFLNHIAADRYASECTKNGINIDIDKFNSFYQRSVTDMVNENIIQRILKNIAWPPKS